MFLCVFFALITACNSDTTEQNQITQNQHSNKPSISSKKEVFQLIENTGIQFNNEIIDYADASINSYDYYYNGGGVAIGDINNDDLPDILFTGNLKENKLYLNKGNLEFEDITDKAGVADKGFWSTGANMMDINSDGWLDIYICHSGPDSRFPNRQNHLYINNQDGTFSEQAKQFGLIENSRSNQSALIDYDLDGDLDLFVMNSTDFINKFGKRTSINEVFKQITEHLKDKKNLDNAVNILFENDGSGKFKRKESECGLANWGYGLGLAVADLNKDNKPDIYVANDYNVPDFMYMNKGGKFSEENKKRIGHNAQFAMGCDVADFNNDAWPDIVNVDMVASDRVRNKTLMPAMNEANFNYLINKKNYQEQFMFNVMQLNNGNGTFSDIGHLTGTTQTDWSWTALLADFDLDSDKDYLVTNGFRRDTKNRDVKQKIKAFQQNKLKAKDKKKNTLEALNLYPSVPLRNYVFENTGNFGFKDVSTDWGLTDKTFSNGAAYGDLDLDGDLDLVINNINKIAYVYKNQSIEKGDKNYLKIKFDSNPKNQNAKITVYTKNEKQYQEFHNIRGYLSSMEPMVYFGLGDHKTIDSLKIEWLYGRSQTLKNVSSNQVLDISYSDGVPTPKRIKKSDSYFVKTDKILDYKHKENSFWDFKFETLLPHKLSTNGPNAAVGDVNGDGLEDIFIGGPIKQIGKLYLQNSSGHFTESKQSAWDNDEMYEDMGVLFFDCDNDKDLDLYIVGGGGNEYTPRAKFLADRLYENDGKGNFKLVENALPQNFTISGSRVKPCDFDKDGDLDLFVGGRLVPRNYPIRAKSFLWENKGGKFVDVTKEKAPQLERIGLVTDFQWTDLNGDDVEELVVVGEWMRIEVFEKQNDVFMNATKKYIGKDLRGWWFSVAAKDIDNDGDVDIVAGNLGLNNKFHASKKKPFEIYYNDFDDNGQNDIVLAKMDDGNQYLMRGKDCSSEQMPFIGEKFDLYENFANATIDEILPKEKLNAALHYSITDFSSIYLENVNGKLTPKQLPIEAQFAPINDILIEDVNKDGNQDLIVAGNLFQTEIETPSYDAGTGYLFLGDGKGTFKPIPMNESGILMNKDVRDLNWITIKGSKHIVVCNNNDELEFWRETR